MSENEHAMLDVSEADLDAVEGGQPTATGVLIGSGLILAGLAVGGPFGVAFAVGVLTGVVTS